MCILRSLWWTLTATVKILFKFQAENSCRAIERHGHRLLVCLVGDSLLEPFWPTGTGCPRGFFGGLDATWLMRQAALGKLNNDVKIVSQLVWPDWAIYWTFGNRLKPLATISLPKSPTFFVKVSKPIIFLCWIDFNLLCATFIPGKMTTLEIISERESIYRLLPQTTPENTSKDYSAYTAEPQTRYPTLNTKLVLPCQVLHLVDTDNPSQVCEVIDHWECEILSGQSYKHFMIAI